MKELQNVGGPEGLSTALETDLKNGLDPSATGTQSIEHHREVFGPNSFAEVPPKSFFSLVLENIRDPIIMLLIFAALVQHRAWVEEGRGPLCTIVVVDCCRFPYLIRGCVDTAAVRGTSSTENLC